MSRGLGDVYKRQVNEQPMSVMEHAGFADEIGRDNFCANIDAALEHAKNIVEG